MEEERKNRGIGAWIGRILVRYPSLTPTVAIGVLLALPVAVWLDLMAITDQSLRRQTEALDSVIDAVRSYYADVVIGGLSDDVVTIATEDYHGRDGAIPIPATMAIDLSERIDGHGIELTYRFVSDYPFKGRDRDALTASEDRALTQFREGYEGQTLFARTGGGMFSQQITLHTPIRMEPACVACHNNHPNSARTDWEVGDIRGVQSFTIKQPVAASLLSFAHLLLYMAIAGTAGTVFSLHQMRLASRFRAQGEELAEGNAFLAGISMKLSRYLSPQVYKSIFSGEKEVEISTERKKLTVFFSDIKDFTQTSETLQPEELTTLLNEYFTEMATIANRHGATIDKFIGDAIVAFFGDPETKGTAEDARACVRMAIEMQRRLRELEQEWRARGIEQPFRARIGINTGYCNVGNFGSEERMDYTIIGAEANLAARLEAAAEPGGIVMSYETYAHVHDIVTAAPMEPRRFKGIAREVIPYAIAPNAGEERPATETSLDGSSITVHLDRLDEDTRAFLEPLLTGKRLGKK